MAGENGWKGPSIVAGTVYGALSLSLLLTLGIAPKTSALLSIRQSLLIGLVLNNQV